MSVRRSRRRTATYKRLGAAAAATVVAAMLSPISPAQAALSEVGPISTEYGYPEYFADADGVRLKFCLDPAEGCVSELPFPSEPVAFPDNFPDEAFWYMLETSAGKMGLYEAALEGAFVNGPVAAGDQMGFGRIRIRIDDLVTGELYTITHPYGVIQEVAEDDPQVGGTVGRINLTLDEGCLAAPCDWNLVRDAFLGDAAGTSATWVRSTNAPAGTLGDFNTPSTVTGSPFGTNYVQVDGPNVGGDGIHTLRVDTFGVMGRIIATPPGTPSVPDLSASSDSGSSSTDNITNITTPTFTGRAEAGTSVELLVNGALAGTATADATGAYSVTTTALADGLHEVQARVPNPAYIPERDPNNPLYDPTLPPLDPPYDTSTPATLTSGLFKFRLDTRAPVSSIGFPRPSNPTADITPTLIFSNDEGGTAECLLKLSSVDPNTEEWEPGCTSPKTYDEQLNGEYTFRTKATDRAGNTGLAATYTWRIGPAVLAPGAPTIGTATPGNASATVTWTAGPDNGSPITGYTVRAFAGSSPTPEVLQTAAATARSVVVPGLTNGVSYTFDVYATNAGGNSPPSARSNAVTPATVPGAPTIGTAVAGNASATVNWTPPASDGGSAITSYSVRVFVGTSTTAARTVSAAGTATSLVVGSLTNGTSYSFDVRAVNARGTSAPSARSNSVIPRAGDTTAPRVTGRSPGINASLVGVAANVTATFSEPVTNVGGTAGTFFLRRVETTTNIAAVVTYNATTRVLTLNPSSNLAADTKYTASLTSGIRDAAGNPLAAESWTFLTGPRPTVTSRSPGAGATGVRRNANVTATFNEQVTGFASGTYNLRNAATGALVSAQLSYNATTRVATLNPGVTLASNTRYTVRLVGGTATTPATTAAIRDLAGNPLATTTWSFTTGTLL